MNYIGSKVRLFDLMSLSRPCACAESTERLFEKHCMLLSHSRIESSGCQIFQEK